MNTALVTALRIFLKLYSDRLSLPNESLAAGTTSEIILDPSTRHYTWSRINSPILNDSSKSGESLLVVNMRVECSSLSW